MDYVVIAGLETSDGGCGGAKRFTYRGRVMIARCRDVRISMHSG